MGEEKVSGGVTLLLNEVIFPTTIPLKNTFVLAALVLIFPWKCKDQHLYNPPN